MLLLYNRAEIENYLKYEDLYRYLKLPGNDSIPQELALEIEKEVIDTYRLLETEVFYREFPSFNIIDDGILISNVLINSYVLSKIASESISVYVFILTIGKKIDMEIDEATKNGRYFKAQVLDACGSVFVEAAADLFMNNIERQLSVSDYALSARYSPGYCDTSIEQQRGIFTLLSEENKSVTLTDSYQMIPQKSISGVFFKIHKRDAERFKRYYSFCRECKNRLCKYYDK